MRKEKRSHKVRSELARLATVPDEEINFDDIPEIRDWSGAVRGRFFRPVKQSISLRVDKDVLAWFKSLGSGYQSRMNAVLRDHMDQSRRPSGSRRGRSAKRAVA
jgi:uncharacterized protein (DUF4415 family)